MKTIYILIVLFCGALFFTILHLITPSDDEIVKKEIEFVTQEEYFGLVKAKYLDRMDHFFRTVEINNCDIEKRITFIRDESGLYDYLMVGDSIWKNKGTLEVRVKRDEIIRTFNIEIPTNK